MAGAVPLLSSKYELFQLNWARDYQSILKKVDQEIDRLKTITPNIETSLSKNKVSNYRKALLQKKQLFEKILGYWLNKPLKEIPIPLRSSVNLEQYYENILRDWSTAVSPEERNHYFELCQKHLQSSPEEIKKVLILGAGPSRLAYDLALHFPKIEFLSTDIHPFLWE